MLSSRLTGSRDKAVALRCRCRSESPSRGAAAQATVSNVHFHTPVGHSAHWAAADAFKTARFRGRERLRFAAPVEQWVSTAAAGEKFSSFCSGNAMLKRVAVAILAALLIAAPAVA